ncbi:C-signal-like [Mantella aurantiaca]
MRNIETSSSVLAVSQGKNPWIMASLQIRNILLTGSNRGIGLEFVQQFLKVSPPLQHIFATCREPNAEQSQALQNLAKKHSNIVILKLDTTDHASMEACVKRVEKELAGRGLDILINNAGVMPPSTLQSVTAEQMSNVYNINTIGPMLASQAFYPLLKKSGHGGSGRAAIVHISAQLGSIEGVPTYFTQFPVISYRCSKVALNMLCKCQALGYKEDGILSIAIHPGWVQTDLGGNKAPLTKEDSVSGMMKNILCLTDKQNGTFVDWKGEKIPW